MKDTNCPVKMPSSRKDCLNLTKELNQYLAKKDSEIRKKLKDGPPSQGDHPIPPEPAPKSFVYYFQFCKYFIVLLHFKQLFLFFHHSCRLRNYRSIANSILGVTGMTLSCWLLLMIGHAFGVIDHTTANQFPLNLIMNPKIYY